VFESERPRGKLVRVFVWLLVALVGGMGWLSFGYGPSLWRMLGGVVLVALSVWLWRVAQNGG
jgi:hypothetical protein